MRTRYWSIKNMVNNMTRKFETGVKFTDPWEDKLERGEFFTTRGQDKLYRTGVVYPVILVPGLFHNGKNYGHHRCFRIEFKRICDYNASEIIADIGRRRAGSSPRAAFYKLMKDWYQFKKWWDGEYTVLQKVYLEKIGLT